MKLYAGSSAVCLFCGEPAEFTCDSRHTVQVTMRLKSLRPGDTVLMNRDKFRIVPRYRITDLILIYWKRIRFAYVTLTGQLGAATVKATGRRHWRVERQQRCGTAVCFRHVRETDDNIHQCANCARQMSLV